MSIQVPSYFGYVHSCLFDINKFRKKSIESECFTHTWTHRSHVHRLHACVALVALVGSDGNIDLQFTDELNTDNI